MLVKFVLRNPGEHKAIGNAKMDAVPREGETVVLNDRGHIVHSVTWDITEMSVTVLIR